MNSILVFGKNGQVASALKVREPKLTYIGSHDCNFVNPGTIEETLNSLQPKLIINTAAFTAVDEAERNRCASFQLNSDAPGRIAKWCAERKAILIHLSSDFVFDGVKTQPYVESDFCNPINIYGESKLAGENEILSAMDKAFIFRTSWVFSETGKNFVKAILKASITSETVPVVTDEFGAPTYAGDLASGLLTVARCLLAIESETKLIALSGIYHIANFGYIDRFSYAQEIFDCALRLGFPIKAKVVPAKTSDGKNSLLQRPKNSRLNCDRLKTNFGFELPEWQLGLETTLRGLRESTNI